MPDNTDALEISSVLRTPSGAVTESTIFKVTFNVKSFIPSYFYFPWANNSLDEKLTFFTKKE